MFSPPSTCSVFLPNVESIPHAPAAANPADRPPPASPGSPTDVINSNTSAATLPIQIRNQTVTSLTPWQTTSTASLSELSAISVSGSTFVAMLPAQSITTYVQ